MKRILIANSILMLYATAAFAVGPFAPPSAYIVNTKHNLSSSGTNTIKANDSTKPGLGTDQICAFCHAPHNPVKNIPLWNRTDPTSMAFTKYSGSITLSHEASSAKIKSSSISMMCLSCHAESIANLAAKAENADIKADGMAAGSTWTNGAIGIGPGQVNSTQDTTNLTDLSNDHPIGFSYSAALTERSNPANGRGTPLQPIATAKASGMQFYNFKDGGTDYTDQMECASCHKTHDNSYPPFLRTDNNASILCRSCHQN